MKVKDLIEKLKQADPDQLVVIESDTQGYFEPVWRITEIKYHAITEHYGEDRYEDNGEDISKCIPAIVFEGP